MAARTLALLRYSCTLLWLVLFLIANVLLAGSVPFARRLTPASSAVNRFEVTLTRRAGLYCGKAASHVCKKCHVAAAAISVVFAVVFGLVELKVPSCRSSEPFIATSLLLRSHPHIRSCVPYPPSLVCNTSQGPTSLNMPTMLLDPGPPLSHIVILLDRLDCVRWQPNVSRVLLLGREGCLASSCIRVLVCDGNVGVEGRVEDVLVCGGRSDMVGALCYLTWSLVWFAARAPRNASGRKQRSAVDLCDCDCDGDCVCLLRPLPLASGLE
ncbi:hypothetical protein KC361_g289 [Hortaea werneckii]|nr:hypothetical protein KC361_g289 [Hortaea werneckii]